MKFKLLAGALLAAVVAVGLWLWFQPRPRPVARSVAAVVEPSVAAPLSQPATHKPAPFPAARMVTVVTPTRNRYVRFNPLDRSWTDIRAIVDNRAGYQERRNAIGHLPARLSAADWRMLREFLLKPNPTDQSQLGQVIKNALMDKLCAMEPPPTGLNGVLIEMYRNDGQNEVIRDYAVQHLATLDVELAGDTGRAAARAERAGQRALWRAVNEINDSIAGTALLGLERMSQAGLPVNQRRLQAAALGLAQNAAAGELARITAYEMCAQLDMRDALPVIEAAAQGSPTTPLQISAIGALGLLGGKNDLPLLQSLLLGSDERLQLPAQTAINRIEQRLGPSTAAPAR